MLSFDPDFLIDHYTRHKGDFGATSENDYERLARNFLMSPLLASPVKCRACPTCSCIAYGCIHVCEVKGDTIRFNTETTELAIVGANGFIRTYFKPTVQLTRGNSFISYFHFRCKP